MPLAVDRLTKQSSPQAIQDAISASIETCMNEPLREGTAEENKQKQCAAISYQIAREKTGKELR
jgi:hypothetical protein